MFPFDSLENRKPLVFWCFQGEKKEILGRKEINLVNSRISHQRCSLRKGVLRNFAKFTGKHLCQSLFFKKVADRSPAVLFKKGLWHRCFLVNFAKILRTPLIQNTSGNCFWMLMILIESFLAGIWTYYLADDGRSVFSLTSSISLREANGYFLK